MSEDNQALVGWLIRGSAEINRMKDEIRTVISIVNSVVGINDEEVIGNGLVFFCDEGYRWAVSLAGSRLVVEMWAGNPNSRGGLWIYTSTDTTVSTRHVKDIHQRLGYLVGGLKEKVSHFNYDISPYVFAAPLLPDVA